MFGPEYIKIQTVFKRDDRGVIVLARRGSEQTTTASKDSS